MAQIFGMPLDGGDSNFDSVAADFLETLSNGMGENVKIGDDTWLGDIDVANTLGIKGIEDETQAYIAFGTSATETIGSDGSNLNINTSNNIVVNAQELYLNSPYNQVGGGGVDGSFRVQDSSGNDLLKVMGEVVLGGTDQYLNAVFPENQIATVGDLAALIDSAPSTLDTLNELAAALGDDANFASTVTTALGAKAPLASPSFTGTVTADTIDATAANATPSLMGNVTTGTISIGSAITSGTVNIATTANGSGLKTINIGTGSLSGTTTLINLGSSVSGSTSTINLTSGGTLKLNGGTIQSGGIGTSATLFSDTQSGSLSIGVNLTTGSLNLANGTLMSNATVNIASGAIASGATKTVNLGANGLSGSTTSIVIGSSAGTSTTTLNGTTSTNRIDSAAVSTIAQLFNNNTSGGIQMGGSLTSGNFNLANGSGYTGTINIATGPTSSGTKTINIGTAGTAGSTTDINIGTGAGGTSTVTLNGGNIYLGGPAGWGFTSQNINFGASGSGIGFFAGNLTTGSMGITNGLTTGTLSLANGTSFAGTVNIASGGTSSGLRTINIGTGGLSGSSTTINVGAASGTTVTNLYGPSVNVPGSLYTSTILATGTAAGNLFNNVNSAGTVDMAAAAGTIHIGRSAATSQLNLLANPAGSGTKTVNIGTASTGGTTTINVGSADGATSVTNLNGAVIIANGGATPISPGTAGLAGQIHWDGDYIYICVSDNNWKRAALSTWS